VAGPEPIVVTPATLRSWPLPAPGNDKAARGRAVVVGGTVSTPGAVLLAGEAALRSGAGKVSIAAPEQIAGTLGVSVPEAKVLGLPTSSGGGVAVNVAPDVASFAEGADAVLVGPGFIDTGESARLLQELARHVASPLVVDALASAYLTAHADGLLHRDGAAVLTVNPTELARTAHREEDEVTRDPYGAARDVAHRSRVVVLCGGQEKVVATPEGRVWVVQGGGHGLGISGSGDVQSGIVAGLLARGAEPAQAAVWGGYLHARAGERLASSIGPVGYLSRELPGQVPPVLAELA
jgi:ADP-dependent NAD(P)H-hydrate dehydratase